MSAVHARTRVACAMLFNKRFTAAWAADGYRDYLSPEIAALESGKAVLSRLLKRGNTESLLALTSSYAAANAVPVDGGDLGDVATAHGAAASSAYSYGLDAGGDASGGSAGGDAAPEATKYGFALPPPPPPPSSAPPADRGVGVGVGANGVGVGGPAPPRSAMLGGGYYNPYAVGGGGATGGATGASTSSPRAGGAVGSGNGGSNGSGGAAAAGASAPPRYGTYSYLTGGASDFGY